VAEEPSSTFKDELWIMNFNKGDTAHWATQARPLEEGEPGYNTETKDLKIGDGVTAFADLPSINPIFKVGDVYIR
jgi:hypothetical protein